MQFSIWFQLWLCLGVQCRPVNKFVTQYYLIFCILLTGSTDRMLALFHQRKLQQKCYKVLCGSAGSCHTRRNAGGITAVLAEWQRPTRIGKPDIWMGAEWRGDGIKDRPHFQQCSHDTSPLGSHGGITAQFWRTFLCMLSSVFSFASHLTSCSVSDLLWTGVFCLSNKDFYSAF